MKDLCGRLPYGVIVAYKSPHGEGDIKLTCNNIGYALQLGNGWWSEIKPYLRPMSSMTEKEENEYQNIVENDGNWVNLLSQNLMEFFNKYHLDYRGLISMGLALKAPEDMYKKE